MSLGRLLTAGKSLIGLKDTECLYRMREKNLLPKFGSPKNPFVRRRETAKAPAPGAASPAPPGPAVMSPAEIAAARLKKTMPLPALAPSAPAETLSHPRPPAGLFRRLAGLAGKLNPFRRRPAGAPFRKGAFSATGAASLQGELCLDNVKVVRNDLNDVDVEIVPARAAAKRKSAAPAAAGEMAGVASLPPR